MKKLRLLTTTVLLLVPAIGALTFLTGPACADIIPTTTEIITRTTTMIPGFPIESIAAGLLLGLVLVLLVSHRGFEWIKTRIGTPILRA